MCRLILPYELHLRGLRRAKSRHVSEQDLPPPPVKDVAQSVQRVHNGQVRNRSSRKVGPVLARKVHVMVLVRGCWCNDLDEAALVILMVLVIMIWIYVSVVVMFCEGSIKDIAVGGSENVGQI